MSENIERSLRELAADASAAHFARAAEGSGLPVGRIVARAHRRRVVRATAGAAASVTAITALVLGGGVLLDALRAPTPQVASDWDAPAELCGAPLPADNAPSSGLTLALSGAPGTLGVGEKFTADAVLAYAASPMKSGSLAGIDLVVTREADGVVVGLAGDRIASSAGTLPLDGPVTSPVDVPLVSCGQGGADDVASPTTPLTAGTYVVFAWQTFVPDGTAGSHPGSARVHGAGVRLTIVPSAPPAAEPTTQPTVRAGTPARTRSADALPLVPFEVPAPAFVAVTGLEDITSDVPPASGQLPDGHYVGLISRLDLANRSVDIDIVQYFGGASADAAVAQDGGGPDGTPFAMNGYEVRDESTRVRTVPLGDVVVVGMPDVTSHEGVLQYVRVSLAALAVETKAPLAQVPTSNPNAVWANTRGIGYCWITVQAGQVVAIDGQYTP
ncbi:MAG TPA: hypothetical protein VIK12_04030 [Pengzhenrongella sp.]